MRTHGPLLFVLCAVLLPASVSALMIDDFENGGFSITDTTPSSGAPPISSEGSLAGVFGGSREAFVILVSGSSATLGVAGGAASATANASNATFRFWYDGLANGALDGVGAFNADLTEGGVNDRFRLEVLSVSGSIDLLIGISSTTDAGHWVESFTVSAPGIVEILFADLPTGADPTNVDSIIFQSNGPIVWSNQAPSFGFFAVVPEPGTGLLAGAGLVGLAARRRRAA